MATQSQSRAKETFILAAAWGQALGLLSRAIFLAAEDAPDVFSRVSVWGFILPVLTVGVLQFTRLRSFLSNNLSRGILALLVMIISLSTFLVSLGDLSLAMSVPEDLVTKGWEYTRITSLLSTLLFLVAVVVNLILSVGSLRSKEASRAEPQPR